MLPPLPPAVEAPAQVFSFVAFKAARVHPASDPRLVAALDRLFQDSPSFRTLLETFSREQPVVVLHLVPMLESSPGGFIVRPLPDSFLVTLRVQMRLAGMGLDCAEPWLGGLLQGLLMVSRQGGVMAVNQVQFKLGPEILRAMRSFQHTLRKELAAANSQPELRLAFNWEDLYLAHVMHFVPRKRWE